MTDDFRINDSRLDHRVLNEASASRNPHAAYASSGILAKAVRDIGQSRQGVSKVDLVAHKAWNVLRHDGV